MGWFDEQIRQRKSDDDKMMEESLAHMADAVTGKHISRLLQNNRKATGNAINDVLAYYKLETCDIPDNIKRADEQIEYAMHPYGIMYRNITLKNGWYKDATGAMIGARKDDGSVISLIPDGMDRYRFFDKESAKWVVVGKNNQNIIAEEAICFYKPLPEGRVDKRGLFKYIGGLFSKADIIAVISATLLVTFFGMINVKISVKLFSDIAESGNYMVLGAAVSFIISIKICMIFMNTFKALILNRLKNKINVNLQAAIMMRVLSLPADFFKAYGTGELAGRLEYINTVSTVLVNAIFSTTLTAVFSVVYIFQIAVYAPGLVKVVLLILLLSIIFTALSAIAQIKITRKQMDVAAKESGMIYAMITGIQKIRLSGAEKRAFARWGSLFAKKSELKYNPPLIIKWNIPVNTLIVSCGMALIYFYAVKDGVSVSDYYAFNIAYAMLSAAFFKFSREVLQSASIKTIFDMVMPVFMAETEKSSGKPAITDIKGNIELDNISFRYSANMPLVIDNLSLKIKAGQYVAIAGATGSGKSTLMRIMLGFEKPDKGAIYYDDRDMNSIDMQSLRKKTGVVMQNGQLFADTIYANIAITSPGLTMEEAWEAARIAGIDDDIRRMPMQMYTMISEGCGGISGGQKQRIMIARAIAAKPKIIMFDEATSALDNLTQKKVSEALDELKCTRVVIAHRLSTIKECDRIIMLDKGRIVEDGTYEELIRHNGKFAELVKRQQVKL